MFGAQMLISLAGLLALLYSAKHYPLIKNIFLFMLFYFATLAFNIEKQANFYLFGLAFGMLIDFYLGDKFKKQADKADLNGAEPGGKVTGIAFEFFSVGLAVALYVIAAVMSSVKGQIMGVAPLAIDSAGTWLNKFLLLVSPLLSGALGMIENYVWFGMFVAFITYKDFFGFIFNLLAMIPIPALSPVFAAIGRFLSLVVPYMLAPLTFGMFHVVAYLFDWGKMLWAAFMMALMIVSYLMSNRDITAANLFHFTWNNNITVKQTLSIIG